MWWVWEALSIICLMVKGLHKCLIMPWNKSKHKLLSRRTTTQKRAKTSVGVAKIKGGQEEVLSTSTEDSRKEKAREWARKGSTSKTKVQRSKMKSTPELIIYGKKWLSQRQDYSEHVNLPSEDEVLQEKTRGEMLRFVLPYKVLQPNKENFSIFTIKPRPWTHCIYGFILKKQREISQLAQNSSFCAGLKLNRWREMKIK